MEIHVVSSLTSDDESRLAPVVMAAIARILKRLPVSYSVRIETAAGTAFQQLYTPTGAGSVEGPREAAGGLDPATPEQAADATPSAKKEH